MSTNVPLTISLDDRSFDLVLLSNWEEKIIYEPAYGNELPPPQKQEMLTTPVNQALESGAWTQSIIWDADTPFRDFTQLELDAEDEAVTTEERHVDVRPRKKARIESGLPRDKYNLSNDHYYEVSKDGLRHRVRQTFGQLVVQHAYPAQKLQLPFVSQAR